jgi:hypothetical protein
MSSIYDPTVNPGDERRRVRYIGIRTPLGAVPIVDVLEQQVIRGKDGEKVLDDLAGFSTQFDAEEVFDVLSPDDDSLTGQTATGAEAFALVYSYIRAQQFKRDQNEL